MIKPNYFFCRERETLLKFLRQWRNDLDQTERRNLAGAIKKTWKRILQMPYTNARKWALSVAGVLCAAGILSVNGQSFLPPVEKPFRLTSNVGVQNFALGDLDNDGDLDILTLGFDESTYELRFGYQENIGSATGALYAPAVSNRFGLSVAEGQMFPMTLADVDQDGDLDVWGAFYDYDDNTYGVIYYENIGTPEAAAFLPGVVDPYGLAGQINTYPFIEFADLDGDGDLDLFYKDVYYTDAIIYLENQPGFTGAPDFSSPPQSNPFGLDTRYDDFDLLNFADLDGDGDLDLLIASYIYDDVRYEDEGNFLYIENTGSKEVPLFDASKMMENPFGLAYQDGFGVIGVADLDADGDVDVLSMELYYYAQFFENETVGINDHTLSDVSIRYIPSENELVLENPRHLTVDNLAVINAEGKTLLWQPVQKAQEQIRIPLSVITGSYVVRVKSGDRWRAETILVP